MMFHHTVNHAEQSAWNGHGSSEEGGADGGGAEGEGRGELGGDEELDF